MLLLYNSLRTLNAHTMQLIQQHPIKTATVMVAFVTLGPHGACSDWADDEAVEATPEWFGLTFETTMGQKFKNQRIQLAKKNLYK